MRLLNTSSITLDEFQGTPPEYAILSHTWLDGEVTLQDLSLDRERAKAGWHKIRNCCRLCRREGWKYVWIDTCCIDKTSSAELSEAINSMFAWYQRAGICYAYLSDVERTHRGEQMEQFARSRWFTRGWTLQELIAPLYLVFVDNSWREIGSRSHLSSSIEQITGISAFHVAHFRGCSIATKMSWAAGRKTTRIEDQAYCLMGLFGINMPLLYGEEGKAFIRLQQEILRVSDDESIFAWRVPEPDFKTYQDVLCGMLAPSADCFAKSATFEPFVLDKERGEYAMTNKGLGMSIDVWRYIGSDGADGARPRRYFAPLNCRSVVDNRPVAVILLHEGEESYVRTDPEALAFWQDETDKSELWELIPRKRLYVRQVEEFSGHPGLVTDARKFYHFTFQASPAVQLLKLDEFPSGSYIASNTYYFAGFGPEYHTANFAKRSFQALLYMEVSQVEIILCISTFNDFFALSIYLSRNFKKQMDILDEAEAELKRATDTVALVIPEQNVTIRARLKPKPVQQLDVVRDADIEKFIQVSVRCQFHEDYLDGSLAERGVVSRDPGSGARFRSRYQDHRSRRKSYSESRRESSAAS
ncbi:heterokaryon incompatibility protein-domain-containing protein [Hypoxylon sp. FL1857]|nr:heterokaryon incompatibility protein-domain-containing protein [Hypoxylon sp. FL1857]